MSTPPLSDRMAEVLKIAEKIAIDTGSDVIGTEHIVLAMYENPLKVFGVAVMVLDKLGVTEETFRAELLRMVPGLTGYKKPDSLNGIDVEGR